MSPRTTLYTGPRWKVTVKLRAVKTTFHKKSCKGRQSQTMHVTKIGHILLNVYTYHLSLDNTAHGILYSFYRSTSRKQT